MSKSKALPAQRLKINWSNLLPALRQWAYDKRWYFLAFFLPVAIMYVAFARFGMYPFGDQCVLILDLAGQYIFYYEGMHDALWGDAGSSIFYNWSRNLSGEFFGTIGYYLASPFNIIVWILPRTMILGAIFIVILLKVGAAAVTFLVFIRKTLPESKWINSIVFSTCYALMAYMVVQTMDPMWLDGLVFLPLILLGIRSLVDRDLKVGYILPLGIMLVAHFYIGMQICIFAVLYFIYYVAFGSDRYKVSGWKGKVKNNLYDLAATCIRFMLCSILAACFAAALLLPVYNALKLGKFEFTDPDFSLRTQFKMLDVLPRMLPNSYDTCRPEGMMDIYAGAITVLLLPLFYLNSKISAKVKIGQTFLLAVLLFSMYIKPLDMMWHGGQVPNWLPYRYSFIFSFVILEMAVMTFSKLDGFSGKAIGGSFAALLGVLIFLELRDYAGMTNYEKNGFNVFKILWFSAICFAVYSLLLALIKKFPNSYILPVILLALVSGELYTNTFTSLNAMNKDVAYTKRSSYYPLVNNGRKVVESIEADDNGLWRGDKTYEARINIPMGFGLRGLGHSTSVMNDSTLQMLQKIGYNASGYTSSYHGANPLTDSIFGFKYILHRESSNGQPAFGWGVDTTYTKLDQYTYSYYNNALDSSSNRKKNGESLIDDPAPNDTIAVYENPNALPIAYMASSDILKITKFDGMNVFYNDNVFLSTLVGKTAGFNTTGGSIELDPVDYFQRVSEYEQPLLRNTTFNTSYNHYDQSGTGDHTVDFHIEAKTSDPIYMFFPTGDQKEVNVWRSTSVMADGNFQENTFDSLGQFFEGANYAIMKVGAFEPGTKICIRCTVLSSYTQIDERLFYYLDMATLEADLNILKNQSMTVTEWSGNSLKGTVNAGKNQILFTTIPYEPGWTIKVDGKKVEPQKVLSSLIGIPVGEGPHTISMVFYPNGFFLGLFLGVVALVAIVFFFIYDRKHNKYLLAKKTAALELKKSNQEKISAKPKTGLDALNSES